MAKKPSAEAKATIAATMGPKSVESITGTCEARVAEYPTAGMVICRVPWKNRGMAMDRAAKTAAMAKSLLVNWAIVGQCTFVGSFYEFMGKTTKKGQSYFLLVRNLRGTMLVITL